MPHRPPALVIFDCDGVLVDSEPISIAVLTAIIREAGGDVAEEIAYRRFLGMSMSSIGGILSEEYGFVFGDEHVEAMRVAVYERFRTELKPVTGVRGALATLDALGCRRCVASSSSLERIRLSLELTGLLDLLEPNLYSAAMVQKGKPAPDLFLRAAQEQGVAPGDCVVVEDSPPGVEAAKRAGMRVFAFTGGSHAERAGLAEKLAALSPDLIFDDMAALPGLIRAGARTGAA